MFPQFSETFQLQQRSATQRSLDLLVLQYPRLRVRNKDGIQSRRKCGVNVRSRTVPNHPCRSMRQPIFLYQAFVNRRVFLRYDLDCREVRLQSGALDFPGLLGEIAFRDQDQVMSPLKITERLLHPGDDFDGMLGNRPRKPMDRFPKRGRQRFNRQSLKGTHQRFDETVQPVPMRYDAVALHLVEHTSYLGGRKLLVLQKRNEICDRTFKINIVLPERVISIDEQRV